MLSSHHLCKACNSPLRDAGKFCPKCGSPVGGSPAPLRVAVSVDPAPDLRVWVEFKEILKLYGVLLLISFSHFLVSKITKHPLGEVGTWVAIAAATVYFSIPHLRHLRELLKPRLPDAGELLLIGAVSLGCYFILIGYFSLFEILKTDTHKYSDNIIKFKWPIWTAYLLTAVCPAILEEIAFRGIIYQKLKEFFSTKEALFIQAACFSVLHLIPSIFISHLIMGLYLGWLRERTNSLTLSILVHFAWNAHVVFMELN